MRCAWWMGVTLLGMVGPTPVSAQDTTSVSLVNDSVTVRFVDADVRAAIQALGRYLPKPVFTGELPSARIAFFSTPEPVPRAAIPRLLQGLVEAQGLEFVEDSAFFRIGAAPVARQGGLQAQVVRPEEPVQLFVVRLKHARASDVAATVNQLFGTGGGLAGSRGLSTGTLSDELRRDAVRTVGGEPGAQESEAASATLTGVTTIVPDELTNSLLVRATQRDFDVLECAIEQLDVRPLQVLIEVLIVEARRDRQFSLGFDLSVPPRRVEGGTIEGDLLTAGLGDLVVRVMSLGKYDINATLAAASQRGDVRIVSRPVLLVSNNTEARLMVGSQRPFVSVSRSLPTDSPQRDQVVQFRDVGTKLAVLPTINQDGYVSLLIQQEISAATTETQFDAPVISTREAVTQVLVADGQTVVLGGLTDEQHDRVRSGVPLLIDLPLVGGLFGSTTTRTTQTELFLFITPSILKNDDDVNRVTAPRLGEPGSRNETRDDHAKNEQSAQSEPKPARRESGSVNQTRGPDES